LRHLNKNGDKIVENWNDLRAGDFKDLKDYYTSSNKPVNSKK
jgi:hypothetical protein